MFWRNGGSLPFLTGTRLDSLFVLTLSNRPPSRQTICFLSSRRLWLRVPVKNNIATGLLPTGKNVPQFTFVSIFSQIENKDFFLGRGCQQTPITFCVIESQKIESICHFEKIW